MLYIKTPLFILFFIISEHRQKYKLPLALTKTYVTFFSLAESTVKEQISLFLLVSVLE